MTSGPSPMASSPPAAICSVPSAGSRLAVPAASEGPKTSLALSGTKKIGQPAVRHLGGHGDVLLAERGHPDGDAGTDRVVDELQCLAEAGAHAGGQGDVVHRAVVGQRRLAGPHVPADLDDLARPRQRAVVGDAVEALDHLGARGAEPEDAAAAGDRIEAGGRHGDQRGRPAVDRQDGRADLHPLGLGGQVPHVARGVVAVGLGHPDDVEPDLLELHRLAGGLFEPAGVAQRHGKLHRVAPSLGPRRGAPMPPRAAARCMVPPRAAAARCIAQQGTDTGSAGATAPASPSDHPSRAQG